MKKNKFLLLIFFTIILSSFFFAGFHVIWRPADDCVFTSTIVITHPLDGATVSGTDRIDVNYSFTETGCYPERIEFVFEDSQGITGPIGTYFADPPYTIPWITTAFWDEIYEISAVAYFESKNPIESEQVTVTIDNEPDPEPPPESPATLTITGFSPGNEATIITDSVQILVNFTSPVPLHLAHVSIKDPSLNEILFIPPDVVVDEGTGILTYQATNLVNGKYEVEIILENEFLQGDVASWEFTVSIPEEDPEEDPVEDPEEVTVETEPIVFNDVTPIILTHPASGSINLQDRVTYSNVNQLVFSLVSSFQINCEVIGSTLNYGTIQGTSGAAFCGIGVSDPTTGESANEQILFSLPFIETPEPEEVPNEPPAILGVDVNPGEIDESTIVTFNVYATDPEEDSLTFLWDFGDGTTATGNPVNHSFEIESETEDSHSFNVSLIVNDGENQITREFPILVKKAESNIITIIQDNVLNQNQGAQDQNDSRPIIVSVTEQVDLIPLILLIVGLFALLIAVNFAHSHLTNKSNDKRDLKREKQNLEKLQKSLESEYMKRHITEKEFKEQFLKNKQKLASLKELLGEKPNSK